tara:strand:+ start:590 stop:943 length:354 start_codon:yes stop_codon:yes gene_type:complete
MTKNLLSLALLIFSSVSCFSQILQFSNDSPYSIEYKIWRNSVVESEGILKPREATGTHPGRIVFQVRYVVNYEKYEALPVGELSYKKLPGNWFEFEILHYGDKTFFIRSPKIELKKA